MVLDCQGKRMELEMALSEMEKTATQQMKCLARESEDALETAKVKLREIGLTLQTYQRFIKVSNMFRSRGGGGGQGVLTVKGREWN